MNDLNLRRDLRNKNQIIFFSLIILFILVFLLFISRITLPLLIAYIIYLIVNPLIPILCKFGLRRLYAVILTFIFIFIFMGYPVIKIMENLIKDAENLQYYIPKIEQSIKTAYIYLVNFLDSKFSFKLDDRYINDLIDLTKSSVQNFFLDFPKILANILEWILLIPIFTFFLLKDDHKLSNILINITPNSLFERTYYLTHEFNKKISGYVMAKFIEALIVGLIITTGLWLMNIKFALIFGLIAAVTNVIPYIGPILGTFPAVAWSFSVYGIHPITGAILLLYIIANVFDMFLVFPILISKIVDLHPVVVIISVVLSSQHFGILGMVISIPLVAILKLIIVETYRSLYYPATK